MEALIALFVIGLMIAGMLIYSILSWGWVCFKFWAWFVLPVFGEAFPNLPHIGFIEACGLMFFIALFKGGGGNVKKEYKDEKGSILTLTLAPWLTLLIGWLFMTFFM